MTPLQELEQQLRLNQMQHQNSSGQSNSENWIDTLGNELSNNSPSKTALSVLQSGKNVYNDMAELSNLANTYNPLSQIMSLPEADTILTSLGMEQDNLDAVTTGMNKDAPLTTEASEWVGGLGIGLGAKGLAKTGKFLDGLTRKSGPTANDTFNALTKNYSELTIPSKDEVMNSTDLLSQATNLIDDLPLETLGALAQKGMNKPRGIANDFSPNIKEAMITQNELSALRNNYNGDTYKRASTIGSPAIIDDPLTTKAFNNYTKNAIIDSDKDFYFTRVGRNESGFGDSPSTEPRWRSAALVDDPNSVDSVNANQYLKYGEGTIYKGSKGDKFKNMIGQGQKNEILVLEDYLDFLNNQGKSQPVNEFNDRLISGTRNLAIGGAIPLTTNNEPELTLDELQNYLDSL